MTTSGSTDGLPEGGVVRGFLGSHDRPRGRYGPAMGVVDDYFASLEPPVRAAFERLRDVAVELSPDAEQATSYGLAALKHRGKPLLGFQVASGHLAVYPFSPAAIDAVRPALEGYALSKGTIRFGLDTPLPDDAVRTLLHHRIAEIEGRAS